MIVDTSRLESAGWITPDTGTLYVVVFAKNHKTLKVGDVVKCVEVLPSRQNYFVRIADATVHSLCSEDQYVIVTTEREAKQA